MPIPATWTITGPVTASLDSLGAISARLTFSYLAEDALELVFPDPGHVASDWAHDTEVTLRRAGSVFFKGLVDRRPRHGSLAEDLRRVRITGPWADLMAMPYAEVWTHWTTGNATGNSTPHPHTILGATASNGKYTDTAEALAQVLSYAADHGVDISTGTLMTGRDVPLIECANRSCGDLIRQILRWHPECQAWINYASSNAFTVSASPSSVSIDASAQGVTWELIQRSDLAVSNVVVSYETEAYDATALDPDDGDPELYKRLRIHQDTAGGSSIGRRTLLVTIPVREGQSDPKCHKQAILTRLLPETGNTSEVCEQWWIDHSPLRRLGIDTGNITLPSTTVGETMAHTLYVWSEAEDENGDPITELIMPTATGIEREVGEFPEYYTGNISRLPRELVEGQLHDWMRRKQGMVTAKATVAVRKTTIDALEETKRAEALRGHPREGTVGGIAAYLYDFTATVRATDAITKVYKHWPGDESGGELTAAEQIIPGLASAIYDARSTAPWEGSISLVAEVAGATRYLPCLANLTNSGVANHTTMAARVRSESLDLASNVTSLTLGIPGHLEPGDFAQLIKIARDCQHDTMAISVAGGAGQDDDAKRRSRRETDRNAVIGSSWGPARKDAEFPPTPPVRRWAPYNAGNGTKLTVGKVWAGESAANATSIGNSTANLTLSTTGGVWLKVGGVNVANITLVSGTPLPAPFEVDGAGNLTYYYKVIGDYSSSDPGAPSYPLMNGNTTVWYRPRVPDADLVAVSTVFEPTGNVANATQGVMLVSC